MTVVGDLVHDLLRSPERARAAGVFLFSGRTTRSSPVYVRKLRGSKPKKPVSALAFSLSINPDERRESTRDRAISLLI